MRIKMANGGMNDVPERTTEDPSGRKIAAPDRIWISTPSDPYVCDFAAFDEPCDDEYHEDIEYVRTARQCEGRMRIKTANGCTYALRPFRLLWVVAVVSFGSALYGWLGFGLTMALALDLDWTRPSRDAARA